MTDAWPRSELDPVRRLRVLAAGIPGAHVTERVLPAPLDRVWAILADLEGGFGTVQPDMHRVRIVHREGDRLQAIAHSRFGMRARFTGILRPGSRSPAASASPGARRWFPWGYAGRPDAPWTG